jgi:outer membrane protein
MRLASFALVALSLAGPAFAQDGSTRTRVALGPQIQPAYPGADQMVVRPFVDFARARGDETFAFEAADQSFDIAVIDNNGFEAGPVIGFEGARRTRYARGLPRVGFSVEPGGFVQYTFAPVRIRAELRQGVTGHEGLTGVVSADYVARDRDDWLFAIGPRVTFANGKYQRAYFGVPAASVAATGLPA